MTPQQKTAIAAKLGVALHTQPDDRLIELCLLYRSAPDALDTFPAALKAEIERRFTPQKIQQEDVTYSVIQNFANQFRSAIPFAHLRLKEMAASVNRDIWFTDNREWFRAAIDNADIAQWLARESAILEACLNNRFALAMLAQSTTAATAILSHEAAVALWKNAADLWDIWPQHPQGMAVLAKSSTLVRYAMDLPAARNALLASATAVNALLASSTAIHTLIASQNDVAAIAASPTAMPLVAASSDMMEALVASSTATGIVFASPAAFQHVADSAVAMSTIVGSHAAMTALNASDAAMHAVTGSAAALAMLLKNRAHLAILEEKLIAASDQVIATVSASPLFQKSSVQISTSVSTAPLGLNTATLYHIKAVYVYWALQIFSGLSNKRVHHTPGNSYWTSASPNTIALAGCRAVFSSGTSSQYVQCDVYTVVS